MKGQQAAILRAIENGAHRCRDISERIGAPIDNVRVRLWELVRLGAVRSYSMRADGRKGRMPKHYRLSQN